MAIISGQAHDAAISTVYFYNELSGSAWFNQPIATRLEQNEEIGGESLVWDSHWSGDDSRQAKLKQRIEAAIGVLYMGCLITQ